MKVLFVCTENLARSPMAEAIFRELVGTDQRHVVRSAGTASYAQRRMTTRELAWADVIAVMEPAHLTAIVEHWPDQLVKARVLDVPDDFDPSDPELRAALSPKIQQLIDELDVARSAGAEARGTHPDGVPPRDNEVPHGVRAPGRGAPAPGRGER